MRLLLDHDDEGSMDQLLEHSITYRIAVGPQRGRKVFTLQTLTDCEPEDELSVPLGVVTRFSANSHDSISISGSKFRLSRYPYRALETEVVVKTVCCGAATYTTARILGLAFRISNASVTTFSGTKCAYTIVILISEWPNKTASF
jgi:hypothetical protein